MNGIDRHRRALAAGCAWLAGFVDAAGFLSADRYFVSFMSGNTTRLGVDLIEAPQRALLPGALICGFVGGVVAGALLAARAGPRRKQAVLALAAALLALAALGHAAKAGGLVLGLLVLAMGALNNTFQRGGEVTVGLTYMTGALVRLGQGLAAWLAGSRNSGWAGWLLLWLSMAGGAAAGAWTWIEWPDLALWLAAGWAGLLALGSGRLRAD